MRLVPIIVGELRTKAYLIYDQGVAALIDPGSEPSRLMRTIKESKALCQYLICTHYHYDHTDACLAVKDALGVDTKIIMHQAEQAQAPFKVDQYVRDNDIITIGRVKLKVVHTPGHTPGSFCLFNEKLIFTGDTLFKDGYGRTDLLGGNETEMEESLEKLKETIKPGMMVYPGHGDYYQA